MSRDSDAKLQSLLDKLAATAPCFQALLEPTTAEQKNRGYYHTLREICQQPSTWTETTKRMVQHRDTLEKRIGPITRDSGGSMILTGSGSSFYVGACLAPALQRELGTTVRAVPAGQLLTDLPATLPPGHRSLIVSLARSGDSPESRAVVDKLLGARSECEHLVITCNPRGCLATQYQTEARVSVIVLDEVTCDRSLVMTSSFTNLLLAGRYLGLLDNEPAYHREGSALSALALKVLEEHGGRFAELAETDYQSTVFLGTSAGYGAARESALKMLEMTSGKVRTLAESYLGLRHGPMSAIHNQTLIVAFLSSKKLRRAYEADLLEELNRKKIGAAKVLLGEDIPLTLVSNEDRAIQLKGLGAVGDDNAAVIQVLTAQLLAFFRCLSLGFSPDHPSPDHVISRVVETFRIHNRYD